MEYSVSGLKVSARTPTMAELTNAIQAAKGEVPQHQYYRDLVRAVVSAETFDKLNQRRPGCFSELGAAIAGDAGIGATINLLEESELDEEHAKAFVDQDAKTPAVFKQDPDDDRAKLFPVSFTVGDSDQRRLILRFPSYQEIDNVRKQPGVENHRAFVKKACVWGDLAGLDTTAPGIFAALGEFLIAQAGGSGVTRLGK